MQAGTSSAGTLPKPAPTRKATKPGYGVGPLTNCVSQGLDPGKASQQQVQQAYLANIGRLRQDYQNNGFDWGKFGLWWLRQVHGNPANQPAVPRRSTAN
jgi:hypothetical protein